MRKKLSRWCCRVVAGAPAGYAGLLLAGWLLPVRAGGPVPEYLTVRDGLPQGFVSAMVQDARGFIWLATRDGLCRYDGIQFRIYHHDPQNSWSLSFSSLYDVKQTPAGRLWLRTEDNTVDLFDPTTEQAYRVSATAAFRRAVGRSVLTALAPDRQGNAWVGTATNGFFRLSSSGAIGQAHWTPTDTSVGRGVRALLTDRRGWLWIGAADGLYRYVPQSGVITRYGPANGLPQPGVWRLHERANGELMLGFPGRFAVFNPRTGTVRTVVNLPGSSATVPLFMNDGRGADYVNQSRYDGQTGLSPAPADPKLRAFQPLSGLVDHSGVLWLGLNGDGVVKYDLTKRPFQPIPYRTTFHTDWLTQQAGIPAAALPADVKRLGSSEVRSLYDGQQRLWLSSRTTPPYRYNPARRQFEAIPAAGIPLKWRPGGTFRLTALAKGPQGELWGLLASPAEPAPAKPTPGAVERPLTKAVARFNPATRTFTVFPLPIPAGQPDDVMAMTVDGGRVYMATRSHGLLRADLSQGRLIRWHTNPADPGALPVDALLSLAQDPAQYNHLWIGTYGSGLCRFDKLTGQIRRFTTQQGLPNDVIYAILPDGQGHLWLSTNRGLCRFDSRSFEVRNYTTDDGLPGEEFNRFEAVRLPNGRLIFGGIGGYTAFEPRRITDDPFQPVVALTALRINSQPVSTADPGSPLTRDINETDELSLDYRQNFVSFDFAALQFNQRGKNQYRHKLTGVDKDWVYSGSQATATYTNLSPGTYTFVVNASNTSGIWSPHTRQVRLVIAPPLWATWWAYALYALLAAGALVTFVVVRVNRIRLKAQMELREQESRQLKHLDEIKTRFFANITHEFRTPLTLILTPLDELLHTIHEPQHHARLTLVHRNASQLLRLINELLDLAKLEAGNLRVSPSRDDLAGFVERCAAPFADEARRRRIDLRVQVPVTQRFYWFDADKLEKILNNLLANAFKYTDAGGLVELSLSARPQPDAPAEAGGPPVPMRQVRLVVRDTGAGIVGHKLPHIFDRFYQADAPDKPTRSGTGIGLALVKELVDIMQGTIAVESRPGLGTTFTVELPCRVGDVPPAPEPAVPATDATPATAAETAGPTGRARLLLVEDNDEIAHFVTDVLKAEWHIRRVNNGQAGLEAALADGPDMVISDVLMPEMNGYELCRALKTNPATNHIPVLLLTAKAADESKVEGLTAGADDYVTKPFQVEELRWRVRNRLEQQRRFRQHLRTQLLQEGHVPTVSSSVEDQFMNQVYAVITSRLDDSTFGVEPLAEAVGLSRMHLNRKVKALSGLTPVELIRAVRLNRAAELLQTNLPISDVAYAVGFDTPAYFSKIFKEQHGLTPSDYVEKHRPKPVEQ